MIIKEHAFKIEYYNSYDVVISELVIADTFEEALDIANECLRERDSLKSILSITRYYPSVFRKSTKTITVNV